MTQNLYVEPAKREKDILPLGLKWALQKRFNFPLIMDETHIKYLEGLRDADVDGALQLIEYIHIWQKIELTIDE